LTPGLLLGAVLTEPRRGRRGSDGRFAAGGTGKRRQGIAPNAPMDIKTGAAAVLCPTFTVLAILIISRQTLLEKMDAAIIRGCLIFRLSRIPHVE
jgi:hypothetical protein